ncbi:MAG: helix-turn-helix transcriptional regulator [Clostridia bacterium]|nr:helix-turn-helix transcriptional regulator [Clostridia bacterium]
MHFLDKSHIIVKIVAAVAVAKDVGTPVHNDRPSHGLAFFYSGNNEYIFADGTRIITEPGDCIYLPKGSFYTVYPYSEPAEDRLCHAVNFQIADDGTFPPFKIKLKDARVSALYKNMIRLRRVSSFHSEEESLSDLYKLISIIKREHSAKYSPSHEKDILNPATDYLLAHYTEEIPNAAELAAMCGISQSYMRKLFNKVHGTSPVGFVHNLRLSYAEQLLMSGEYSVTQISLLSGFGDPAYFSREFKKRFALSPSKYVKSHI